MRGRFMVFTAERETSFEIDRRNCLSKLLGKQFWLRITLSVAIISKALLRWWDLAVKRAMIYESFGGVWIIYTWLCYIYVEFRENGGGFRKSSEGRQPVKWMYAGIHFPLLVDGRYGFSWAVEKYTYCGGARIAHPLSPPPLAPVPPVW